MDETNKLWGKDARIIELGARDAQGVKQLLAAGYERCLTVLDDALAAATAIQQQPRLQQHIAVANVRQSVRKNNAEVLILHGRASLAIGRIRQVRHAQWVAVPLSFTPSGITAIALGLLQSKLKKLDRPHLVSLSTQKMLAFKVRKPSPVGARRFIPHQFSVTEFFTRLRERNIKYAVLRWFDALPAVAPGEDLDLLVEDSGCDAVSELLNAGPGLQAVDLYSVSGLPQCDFQNLPYYPPRLAQELIDRAQVHKGLFRVPAPQDHFHSLAYHALYHKGESSGVPATKQTINSRTAADHDYPAVLQLLAEQLNIEVPITLTDLDQYLELQGWRPPHDMLARLARRNRWVRSLLGTWRDEQEDHGLAVFLLREHALKHGGIDRLSRMLERHGFYVLEQIAFNAEQSNAVAASIRGGNWGRGPWAVSGGIPAAAVVTYDFDPIAVTKGQKKRYPFLTNARSLCKGSIRDEFNRGLSTTEQFNALHSSDNGSEALAYLRIIKPDSVERILADIAKLKRDFETDSAVVATCTKSGRRAKIEVLAQGDRLLVKKTFKPHQYSFCQREAQTLRDLHQIVSEVPPLVEHGQGWLTLPYYDNVLGYQRSSGKLLPLPVARQAIEALRRVYEAGYALIDASIDNLLVDRHEGLKLIDFEFSHRYEAKPDSFEKSYDVVGCPPGFAGDLPIQGGNSYDRNWRPYIGLSLQSLLADPTWLQHVKRGIYFVTHAHRFVPRQMRWYATGLWKSATGRAKPAASKLTLPARCEPTSQPAGRSRAA